MNRPQPSALYHAIITVMTLPMSTTVLANTADGEPSVVLPEMVITAEAQVKQSLGVSNITASDLEKTPITNDISEIVRKMPGVNLTGNSATGQRGNNRQIDLRSMGPENTLILVDGRPITSRNAVRYGWRGERDTRGDSQWIPTEAIESVEVVRGPAAARYGSGAMGGVVNIVTKKVSNDLRGSTSTYANLPEDSKEGGSRRISTSLSGALVPDRVGFRVYGSYNQTDMDAVDLNPLVEYSNGNRGNYLVRAAGREGVKNTDIGAKLTWQMSPAHTLSIDTTYSRQGNEYTGDTQYSNRDASQSVANSVTAASNAILSTLIGTQTNRMTRQSYALTHDGDYKWGDWQAVLQYDHTKNSRLNEGLAGGPEGVISGTNFEDVTLKTIRMSGVAHLPLSFGVPQTLTIGAEYVHDSLHDHANVDEGTATGTDRNALYADAFVSGDRTKMTSKIASVYVEDNLELNDKTNLVLATRFDHHNKSGANLSPAINLTHHFNDNWTLKAGIARAYKAPNLYQSSEGYLLGTRGNGCPIGLFPQGQVQWCVLQGNENLKPETSINSEIGMHFNNDNINASLTYFHNDYKDKITAGSEVIQTVTLPYVQQGRTINQNYHLLKWTNTPKALVEGIEGNLTWTFGNFRLSNNLTYMLNSKDKRTGNPLSLIPTFTYNANLGYDINDHWDVNASYTHYGKQKPRQIAENNIENVYNDGLLHNQEVKGYGIISVNAGYRLNDRFSARFGVNNLFDEQRLRDNTLSQSYNEPGRSYFASVKYEY